MNLFSIQSGNTVQIFYNDYVVGSADSSKFSKTGPSSSGKDDGTCFIKGWDSILTSSTLLLKAEGRGTESLVCIVGRRVGAENFP